MTNHQSTLDKHCGSSYPSSMCYTLYVICSRHVEAEIESIEYSSSIFSFLYNVCCDCFEFF